MKDKSKFEPTPSNSRLHAPFIPHIHQISIDKIRVMGDYNTRFVSDLLTIDDVNLDISTNEDYTIIKGKYTNSENATLNFEYNKKKAAVTKSSNMYIEWNPNKFHDDDLMNLKDILFKYINNAHVTRIDLAFDIETDLSDYQVFRERPIISSVFYGRDGSVETRYIGSPNSDRYIKVYNKKLELMEKQNIYIDLENLWRFEITLKTNKLNDISDALKNIHFYLPSFEQMDTVQESAMLYYLMLSENNWKKIDRKTKTKYRKIIKETQDFSLTEILDKHLQMQKEILINQMNLYLNLFNTHKKIHSSTGR